MGWGGRGGAVRERTDEVAWESWLPEWGQPWRGREKAVERRQRDERRQYAILRIMPIN